MQDHHEQTDATPPPGRRSRRWLLGAAGTAAAAAAAGLWLRDRGDAAPGDMDLAGLAPATGGRTDLTFFVTADTHFGREGMAERCRHQIETMNALPGTALPALGGTKVARPEGVLVAGDLADEGQADEWKQFVEHYGLTGRDGMLEYPVQECTGNHDRIVLGSKPVLAGVRKRHGSLVRGWVWRGVCFFCLDCYPTAEACEWLRRQLGRVGPKRPGVVYFHYTILGPLSDYWSDAEKRTFAETIRGHNILGIFHGHYHATTRYTWEGFKVYNVGPPEKTPQSFAVAHVADGLMTVA